MILFKFLSLFLVKSSPVAQRGFQLPVLTADPFFSPESGKTPDAGREANCGSDKAPEISTIRGKTTLIVKINANSMLIAAWLPSAGGREQDLLPAKLPELV